MVKEKSKNGRAGGILLHPTSLPGRDGIGDLGDGALHWLDWLKSTGCSIWQVLPLGPTGYGDSPYQSFSTKAGNPMLIDLRALIGDGLLRNEDFNFDETFSEDRVEYGPVIQHKDGLLRLASERFRSGSGEKLRVDYQAFCLDHQEWLDEFSLFMALKEANSGAPWPSWDQSLRQRVPEAIEGAKIELAEKIEDHKLRQFLFFRQWTIIRRKAENLGIKIIGDVPIFLAHDSADVWTNFELFHLDREGMPTVVAGVPPDYFSPTGQLWGNPLYRWDLLKEEDYAWWVSRMKSVLSLVDVVRLDHFRGFEAYWEIPAEAPTAETGRWVKGPGSEFFSTIQQELGELPLIAEDLGVITPGVEKLRESYNLPGMKVLQFAFDGDSENDFLPHNYPTRCLVYTGTHDNDTTTGWFQNASDDERDYCRRYLASSGDDIAWALIRSAWSSVADIAIAPMQDFLSLGSKARMNYPSRAEGNWTWRVNERELTASLAGRIWELNSLYGRLDSYDRKAAD
ncbi:MAG: 4-alpha-glucanotransferase [Anaerolineales bacterium]|nr:4-alpha-glucanotransferase [Anaerolineales bacterium]